MESNGINMNQSQHYMKVERNQMEPNGITWNQNEINMEST